jgi:hypothetical protein
MPWSNDRSYHKPEIIGSGRNIILVTFAASVLLWPLKEGWKSMRNTVAKLILGFLFMMRYI